MKTILVLISIMILGLYSCEKASTNAIQDKGEILEISLFKDNGFSNNSPDTLLVTKENITLKYGKMTKENKWIFKELKDTSSLKIAFIFELVNSINVYEFESKYLGNPDVVDLSKYIFEFKTKSDSKVIEYKYSETNPDKLKNFIKQIDSITKDYKFKYPLE